MDAFGLNALLAGTASSLLAVGCVESYFAIRRRLYHRTLKNVLGLHKGPTIIVAPLKQGDSDLRAISYRDAYAFGHLFALCHKVGVEARLVPFHRMSDIGDENNFFSVGGPSANRFTESELIRFVPGFRILTPGKTAISVGSGAPGGGKSPGGFVVGDVRLLATELEEPGILIKLTPKVLNQDRTIHLIFGYSGQGTGGAAYFLWKYHKRLNAAFKKERYCVAVKVHRNESYKSTERTFTDLTKQAFATAVPNSSLAIRETYNPTLNRTPEDAG